jgi:hypothetical protein
MQPIHAAISGTTCTALRITAAGAAPVLALCRKLIEARSCALDVSHNGSPSDRNAAPAVPI